MSLKSYAQECKSVEGHSISFINVEEEKLGEPFLAEDKCPLGFSRLKLTNIKFLHKAVI